MSKIIILGNGPSLNYIIEKGYATSSINVDILDVFLYKKLYKNKNII